MRACSGTPADVRADLEVCCCISRPVCDLHLLVASRGLFIVVVCLHGIAITAFISTISALFSLLKSGRPHWRPTARCLALQGIQLHLLLVSHTHG